MQRKQAQAIFDSLGVIEVKHRGKPVFIEQIDEDSALIQYIRTREKARVPLSELETTDTGF